MPIVPAEAPGRLALSRIVERVRFAMQRAASPERLAQSMVQGLGLDQLDAGHRHAAQLACVLRRDPADLARSIGTMRDDPLVNTHLARQLLRQQLFGDAKPSVVSMGAHCYTSAMLVRWGLRPWAGPFDWLFSSPAMVRHCLDDDFAWLLDRSLYRPVPLEARPAGRDVNRVNHVGFLQKFGIEFVFNHHDVHLDEGYAYMQRCVARYRRCLQTDDPTIHLLNCWYYEGVESDLEALAQSLAQRSRHGRMVAFVIRDASDQLSPKIDLIQRQSHLSAYLLQPVSRWQALDFPEFADEYALVRVLANEVGPNPGGQAEASIRGS